GGKTPVGEGGRSGEESKEGGARRFPEILPVIRRQEEECQLARPGDEACAGEETRFRGPAPDGRHPRRSAQARDRTEGGSEAVARGEGATRPGG
ncbi:MAG TPA: hypothetical protein VF999_01360, partial [Thermoanaerobaculia bacterium]